MLSLGRIESAVDHPLRTLVAGQRGSDCVARTDNGVADVHLLDILDVADQITNLPGHEFLAGPALRHKLANLQHLMRGACFEKAHLLPAFDRAVYQANIRDGPAVAVVVAVKDHGAKHTIRIAGGGRHTLDDRRQ